MTIYIKLIGFNDFASAEVSIRNSNKGFKNDLDEYLPPLELSHEILSGMKGFQKDGYLYVLVDAFKFFEEGAKPPFPELVEDSNPVLVKLRLKK